MKNVQTTDQKLPANSIRSKDSDTEANDEDYAWFFNPKVFLPGKVTSFRTCSMFPFLAIGRFLPLSDFISDIATAGPSWKIL